MNKLLIGKILGVLLLIEGVLLAACSAFGFVLHEPDGAAFLVSSAITLAVGVVCYWMGRKAGRQLNRKGGYFIVAFCWVLFSAFGMLPYLFSGCLTTVTDAFFETMSGFTTTGATVINDVERLPHGLLFWRSLTQWIGGLGIVFFTLAVLPIFGVGGVRLFAAEATGPTKQKISPRIEVTARWIWTIYLGLTAAESLALMGCGVNWFHSICHALTTTATGGFSTFNGGVAALQSHAAENVITLFMFLAGINFTLIYFVFIRFQIRKAWRNTELKCYLAVVLILGLWVTVWLMLTSSYHVLDACRQSFFFVLSVFTSTGFAPVDPLVWGGSIMLVFLALSTVGACSGSTTGGIKCIRIVIAAKAARNEFQRIMHPNAVLPVRINGQVLHDNTKSMVYTFLYVYLVIVLLFWILLTALGVDQEKAFGITVACLSNLGLGLGNFDPGATWQPLATVVKWVACFLMLLGRLELFTILLMFTPAFWRKRY